MAKSLASHFTTKKRGMGPDAVRFVTLRANRPEWLQEAVYAAHDGTTPCDWVYAECLAACEGIDSGELTEENESEYADGRVDTYTRDRFTWAAEFCLSNLWADAEGQAKEIEGDSCPDTGDRIGHVQYFAIQAIANTILRAANEAGRGAA